MIRYSHLKSGKIVSCGKCYKPQEKLVKSLIGVPCGRLMPIERLEGNKYRCKCECGNETIVDGGNLRTKNTRSCGCLQKEIASKTAGKINKGNYKDLSKDKFDRLKPLYIHHVEDGVPYWFCQCDCGNTKVVSRAYLVDSVTRSCGCLRKELARESLIDIKDHRFDMLVAIEYAGYINGRAMWKFKCDCGNERIYDPYKVKNGYINSYSGQCTPRYYWYLRGKELKRESCKLEHLKRNFPELLQEAYDKNAPNKEDYVMLKL